MKKVTIAMFGVSVFAGLGYVAFAKTPVGKNTLVKWLLKKWKAATELKGGNVNFDQIKRELNHLEYDDLELLAHYTWRFPFLPREGQLDDKKLKRFESFMKKFKQKKIFEIANFSALENIVFPG